MTLRRLLLLALVGTLAATGLAKVALGRGATPIGTGVVTITTVLGYQSGEAAGTGIVLRPSGEILTNNHVIANATAVTVSLPGTGHNYRGRVVGYDVSHDVAVVRVSGATNLATSTLDPAATVSVGQNVRALGNAGGAGSLKSAYGRITGTGKSITAQDDQGDTERLSGLIETNAGVLAGDSGGPLLNARGKVIGITTAASTNGPFGFGNTPASDAYAIPVGRALTIARAIDAGKSSASIHIGPTPFLGIQVGAPDTGESGAVIVAVVPGGPADSAGLVPGDLITSIDGRTVAAPTSVGAYVLTKKPGVRVSVHYMDNSGTHAVTVKLGSGPPH